MREIERVRVRMRETSSVHPHSIKQELYIEQNEDVLVDNFSLV